jgi:hypothetical protein
MSDVEKLPEELDEAEEWGDVLPDGADIFRREMQDDGRKVLVVTAAARKNWSGKNPKKFDPETAMKIVTYVSGGNFLQVAASAAGINRKTLYNWMQAGNNSKHQHSTPELCAWKRALDEAQAFAEARAVAGILTAGSMQWQAFAWYLERSRPERWRAKTSVIQENPDGTPALPMVVAVIPNNSRGPRTDDGSAEG